MIQFENISKSFPSGSLFKDVNLTIKRGVRVGLVGKNGSGKTTLLKMMLGKESPDSGSIKKEKDLTIGYLQQEIVVGTERSIIEEVMASYPGAYDLEKKIINDDELELIDAKSWIQTIPNLEDSKFLFYESKSKYYGFLLNFYKKRFMHIDLKAYIGNVNSRSSNINIFIDNDKRIFNDEVHFFDHPYFGLILSIKEV